MGSDKHEDGADKAAARALVVLKAMLTMLRRTTLLLRPLLTGSSTDHASRVVRGAVGRGKLK